MTWADFWATVLPPFLSFLAVLVTVSLGWAARAIQRRTGIAVEEKDMLALHSALMTGVQSAMSKATAVSGTPVSPAIIRSAVEYAQTSVPDAMRRLKPSVEILRSLAEAKASQVETSAKPKPC